MNGNGKRRKHDGYDLSSEGEIRSNQSLPVAELSADFDGIPLDGAQYLAVVRKESQTVPSVIYVANPYAKEESENLPLSTHFDSRREIPSSTCMPSKEWRRSFLSRFANMRESLANRSDKGLSTYPDKIPRGRNGKKWYRFLHGRDLIEDVEYDDEEEKGSDAEGAVREDAEAVFKCREPSEALLHHFGTPRIISLLSLIPYWLTQPHILPERGRRQAIDPFHSRWLFALLAHLDDQLVGDDISVLRILARACLASIVQSRIQATHTRERQDILQDELGAWIIICAIAGIWGQHDLWQDGQDSLEQCVRMQQNTP